MPPRKKISKAEQARRYLSHGGVAREDSDDELGLDDHPWVWIYETKDGYESEEDAPSEDNGTKQRGRKRKRKSTTQKKKKEADIVGARMGDFECRTGDAVLVKAEGHSQAWVGLIVDFKEDEDDGEKLAHFMWFSSEKEIVNNAKKRKDFLQNELYIQPAWDWNPLTTINGKATVVSTQTFHKKYPKGIIPRKSKDFGKLFVCRRACNTKTTTYGEEFDWEENYNGTIEDIQGLFDLVEKGTKASRKPRSVPKEEPDFDFDDEESENEDYIQKTPKKRKTTAASTPSKNRTPSKLVTPSHKRIMTKKPLEFTPLGTRILDADHVHSSPFQIARSKLHVSAVPASLPCREKEFTEVYTHLEAAITSATGACIYISGTPGTGKTATVREVVSQLNVSVLNEELDDFIFVEINGMKVTDPHQSYSLLWEALKGDRVSPSHALDLLEREFNNPSPRRVPCVVLMDELDQLVTRNQSVMYNFFNWPGLRHSRLIVLAVANTMDLPERTLSNKISSRLGLTRITFPGYDHSQLMQIIQSRLSGVPNTIVDPDAIQFASRKVAAVSGDARRCLDICRRAVEIAEAAALASGSAQTNDPSTPSRRAKAKETGGAAGINKGKVTIATIRKAIDEATSTPLHHHLRTLSLASKLFLAALLAKIRRTGLGETILGEVVDEAKRMGKMSGNGNIQDFLLSALELNASDNSGGGKGKGSKEMKKKSSARVLGMGGAVMELMEAGIVVVERKGERMGRVRLGVGDEEVRGALKDDGDVKGLF